MMSTISGRAKKRGFISGIRLAQALVALLVLLACAWASGVNPLDEWWFWTAATAMVTAAVAEPYYTGPVAALLYGVAGASAGLTAERSGVEVLWSSYFVLAGAVIVSSVLALVDQSGRSGAVARWVATRFGRPMWLGIVAVGIELIRGVNERGLTETGLICTAVLIGTIVSVPDWYRLIITARPGAGGLTIVEAAIDPNLILVSAMPRLKAGQLVRIAGQGKTDGVVIGNLAHRSGNRSQIALSRPWTSVVGVSGDTVEVEIVEPEEGPSLGFVTEGSTDRALDLRTFGAIARGDTICWTDSQSSKTFVYQVLGLELKHTVWEGSATIAEHARAGLLGVISELGVEPEYKLPAPYSPVFAARNISSSLPNGYTKVGRISGTQIPVGISAAVLRSHHMAVLGMSGMGKSTIARKLVDLLASDGTVVALDGTGEYRSRFGMPEWSNTVGLSSDGNWVYEPAGVQAQRAEEFIGQVMTVASSEYAAGVPRNRSILLEEAHSYLPEWNFVASRNETDFVSKSCRYILQSRKFKINFILISQRTAVISKSALSQCESYIIFRTLDDTSLQYVEGVVGSEYRDIASSLKRFQAICVGPAFNATVPVVVDLDPFDEA